jgi:hypothetical protein
VAQKKTNRKILHIPLDTLQPVDAEVYGILHEFKSSVECKNYLMSAVLYYSRSPLVMAANALADSFGVSKLSDYFSGVHEKLDVILSEVRSIGDRPAVAVDSGAGGLEGVGSSAGEGVLDSGTKTVLASLKQSFKV